MKQCWKFPQVRRSEADSFGGGPGTFCWFFFNFMFMIWDSRHEDLQLFWLSFKHCYEEFLFFYNHLSWLTQGVIQNINQCPIYIYTSYNKIVQTKLINLFCTQHSNSSIIHLRCGCCPCLIWSCWWGWQKKNQVFELQRKHLQTHPHRWSMGYCFCLFVFLEE